MVVSDIANNIEYVPFHGALSLNFLAMAEDKAFSSYENKGCYELYILTVFCLYFCVYIKSNKILQYILRSKLLTRITLQY